MTMHPAVKAWEWMTADEQVHHLFETHGYKGDYFSHDDDTQWTDDEVIQMFGDPETRNDYHAEDHADTPYGGGKEHTHDGVHPTEVAQAIESIKRAVNRGQATSSDLRPG